jgi:hypothetical protein
MVLFLPWLLLFLSCDSDFHIDVPSDAWSGNAAGDYFI